MTGKPGRLECSVDGCVVKSHAKGVCQLHYARVVKHGSPHINLRDMSIKERFERKIRKNKESGCWLWTGTIFSSGYGMLGVSKKYKRAHRISWELHNGPIPTGKLVLHECDVRHCVNPNHLFLGTFKDNFDDAVTKGRLIRGATGFVSLRSAPENIPEEADVS